MNVADVQRFEMLNTNLGNAWHEATNTDRLRKHNLISIAQLPLANCGNIPWNILRKQSSLVGSSRLHSISQSAVDIKNNVIQTNLTWVSKEKNKQNTKQKIKTPMQFLHKAPNVWKITFTKTKREWPNRASSYNKYNLAVCKPDRSFGLGSACLHTTSFTFRNYVRDDF